jgi:hypothetical protein
VWRRDVALTPSYYLMQLEREEMMHAFLGSLMTGQSPFLPFSANEFNATSSSNVPSDLPTAFTFSASPDDPRSSTWFWRQALVSTCEVFYLEQFLMWLQLFKYVPVEDQQSLAPPAVVWQIWTLFALSPASAFAYQSFCMRYLGRVLSISDCATLDEINMSQDYRSYSWKSRMRHTTSIFAFPREYDLRLFTYLRLLNLNGYADAFTWNPEACDPSCFGGRARVLLANGRLCELRRVRIGDHVIASSGRARRVVAIRKSAAGRKAMVRLNGFWITRGHPVWWPARDSSSAWNNCDISNRSPSSLAMMRCDLASSLSGCCCWSSPIGDGAWMRPDELLPVQWLAIETVHGIYNLVLDDDHDVLVYPDVDGDVEASQANGLSGVAKPVVCCTLGRYCGERLALLYPHQNRQYGTKLLGEK